MSLHFHSRHSVQAPPNRQIVRDSLFTEFRKYRYVSPQKNFCPRSVHSRRAEGHGGSLKKYFCVHRTQQLESLKDILFWISAQLEQRMTTHRCLLDAASEWRFADPTERATQRRLRTERSDRRRAAGRSPQRNHAEVDDTRGLPARPLSSQTGCPRRKAPVGAERKVERFLRPMSRSNDDAPSSPPTRRRRNRVAIEDEERVQRRPLLSSHVREGGEATAHVCNICQSKLFAWSDSHPLWVQAPCCSEVWHSPCLFKHVLLTTQEGRWSCPQCKMTHDEEAPEDWVGTEAYHRLFPEEPYTPDTPDGPTRGSCRRSPRTARSP